MADLIGLAYNIDGATPTYTSGYKATDYNDQHAAIYTDGTDVIHYGTNEIRLYKLDGDSSGGMLELAGAQAALVKCGVQGTSILLGDDHVGLNHGYTTVAAVTGGVTVVYSPTATTDNTGGAGIFTAGVAGVSDPIVTTNGAATFAEGDLVQLSGSLNNDGLYEVSGHAANTMSVRSTANGLVNQLVDFTRNDFYAETDTGVTITKVNVSSIRSGTDGVWEVAKGSATGPNGGPAIYTYSDVMTASTVTLDAAYENDPQVTINDGNGPIQISQEGGSVNYDGLLFDSLMYLEFAGSTDVWKISTQTAPDVLEIYGPVVAANTTGEGFVFVLSDGGATSPGGGAAGDAGAYSITLGNGGAASTNPGDTSGVGGDYILTLGSGGAGDNTVPEDGGKGGSGYYFGGSGGVDGGAGGGGGDFWMYGGSGGDSTTYATGVGGLGGNISIYGGQGGDGHAGAGTGGAGGNIYLQAGTGGSANTVGSGGVVTIDAGLDGAFSVSSDISIGPTIAGNINLGNAVDNTVLNILGTGKIDIADNKVIEIKDNSSTSIRFQPEGISQPVVFTIDTTDSSEQIISYRRHGIQVDTGVVSQTATLWFESSDNTPAAFTGYEDYEAVTKKGLVTDEKGIFQLYDTDGTDRLSCELHLGEYDYTGTADLHSSLIFNGVTGASLFRSVAFGYSSSSQWIEIKPIANSVGDVNGVDFLGIKTQDRNTGSCEFSIRTGEVNTSGSSGLMIIGSGDITGGSGQSGDVTLLTGDTGSGDPGILYLVTGDTTSGTVQDINMLPGGIGGQAARAEVVIGDSTDTVRNTLRIYDGGGSGQEGGQIILHASDGTAYYIWVDTTGDLRIGATHSGDLDGAVVGTQT